MKKSLSTAERIFIFCVRTSIIICLIILCLLYIHIYNLKQANEEKKVNNRNLTSKEIRANFNNSKK